MYLSNKDSMNVIKELASGQEGFGLLIERDCGYISPDDERNKKFIQETHNFGNPNYELNIVEPLYVYAILQKYGVKNRNGRVYSEEILRREDNKYQQIIKNKSAFGELEHPNSADINSDRISHHIVETWWEGKTLMGKLEIIMSPGFIKNGIISCSGDKLANFLRKGLTVGVSSRGTGTVVKQNGLLIVQPDFEMICWDAVIRPSTPGSLIFDDIKKSKPFVESVDYQAIKNNNDDFIDNFLKNF